MAKKKKVITVSEKAAFQQEFDALVKKHFGCELLGARIDLASHQLPDVGDLCRVSKPSKFVATAKHSNNEPNLFTVFAIEERDDHTYQMCKGLWTEDTEEKDGILSLQFGKDKKYVLFQHGTSGDGIWKIYDSEQIALLVKRQ